jgi:CYTH domain-containing protein
MAIETERKFLVNRTLWAMVQPYESVTVRQGYLHSDDVKTIRIRTMGSKGFITIKGKTAGISRTEYEYAIPFDEAAVMLDRFAGNIVEKTRHYVRHEGKVWEVDEFGGDNTGLWVAEIELSSEDEIFAKPDWITEEVTHDYRYSNSNLAKKPFMMW